MQAVHWRLLAELSDGLPKHIAALAGKAGVKPQQLNGLWLKMPAHIRGLLRQQDGYWRLVRPLAVFSDEYLSAVAGGFRAELLHTHPSSNDAVLMAAKRDIDAAHRYLCIVHEQTKGRGRQGRSWYSRIGECLTFSFGWVFERQQGELGALSLAVGLACCNALQRLGVPVQLKWPNDLVVGSDKLGGILIETMRSGGKTAAVIGIGLNFVLPKEIENATSVQAACQSVPPSAAELLGILLGELDGILSEFAVHGFAPFLAAYEAANRDQGASVRLLHNGQVLEEGTVLGVTEQGVLRLETAGGEKRIASGEISLRQSIAPAGRAATRYLLLDGGNSRLKWAWAENGKIGNVSGAPYRDLQQLGEDWRHFGGNGVAIVGSAVCGDEKKALVQEQLAAEIEWLPSMPHALGIRNHYRNPAEHGSDRWFNALGSRRFSRNACVVVSCGTAVTVDALTDDGHYLGGTIMPGFHLMKESLAVKTANLNRPVGKVYPFPTTTGNAVASGMMDAVCGSVMMMHGRLKEKIGAGKPVDVIITGGGAAKVAEAMPSAFLEANTVRVVDNLVIYGLLNMIAAEGREYEHI